MIGQVISHYKILEKLGEGGMGIVYKAHDTKLDRVVALKFLPHYLTSDANERERFYHEARAASALNHPNITTIYEIQEFDNQLYLAMEFVEGKTLKKLVDQEPPSIKKVLDIAIQACDGLAAAHEKRIVHRDIKSDNIMITPKGQVKLMDFGLAKVKGAMKLTKAGSTLGTAAYMSPEQAQGEEVDHRSDIFSFGVVLYELLTGTLPFRGEHQAAMMYSLINEDPQPIPRFNDKVSPDFERIVLKALAKVAEERYQHVDDMLADLRRERKSLEYAKAGYVRSSPSLPLIEPVKPKKNFLKYVISASAIVVLVIAFVIFNPFNYQITTQKTAASEKNSLAVLYFQNIADPEDKDHTGDMLADLLITALSQAKGMEVVSRERLYDIQKELGQADAKTIPASIATKVAQRAGVTTMLLGSILQQQPVLAVTFRLIDVKSGNILGSQRLTSFSSEKIYSLVDTMALLVQNSLNVSPAASLEAKSIAEVTTKSPEAYRSYIEGVELANKFYLPEAKAAYRRAIELDSNFAMAYFRLALTNLGSDFIEGRRLVEKAWQLKNNVNERERLHIQSLYVGVTENDPRKSIDVMEAIIEKYPHEQSVYASLVNLYAVIREFDKSIQSCQRGLAADSLDKILWNSLAYASTYVGRRQEALAAIDRYMQLAPAEPNPYDSKGDVYFAFGDRDSAEYWWRKALTFRPDFLSGKKIAYLDLIHQRYDQGEKLFLQYASSQGEQRDLWVPVYQLHEWLYQGKLNQVLIRSEAMLTAHKERQLYNWMVGYYLVLAMTYYEQGNYPAMLEAIKRRTRDVPDHQTDTIYGRDLLAFAYVKNGKKESAAQVIQEIQRDIPKLLWLLQAQLDYYSAVVAYEEGRYDAALEQFNKVLQRLPRVHAPLYFHAVSLLKAGHPAEAIDELQRATWWISSDNGTLDLEFALGAVAYAPISAVKAHYWLGVAYEQQGKKDEAIKEYEKFLEIWKDADFKSKELDDAKVRLAKLKGIATK